MSAELPQGQGIWIWQIRETAEGKPERIAQDCARQGFAHGLIKCADGAADYAPNRALDHSVCRALRNRGVQAIGWGYHYGERPEAEAMAAAAACRRLGLRTYLLNAEREFERPGGADQLRRWIEAFRRELGQRAALGLSTFALPQAHPSFPYQTALSGEGGCDFVSPQIYTTASKRFPFVQRAQTYWKESKAQLERFGKPIVPTFRAYLGDGVSDWGFVTREALAIAASARQWGAEAFNWWVWQSAQRHEPLWEALGRNGQP